MTAFSIEPTKKYAMRLFRLYGVWTLVCFPLSFKEFFQDGKGFTHAVLVYARNCIFAGSYFHLWYLPATIFSVLLIPFLLYKRVSTKKIIVAALILYLVGLLAQSWFGLIEPLLDSVPQIWQLLKITKKIIVTTRDGLFEGFLFVGIGMLFAFYNLSVSKKKSLIGFTIAMILMLFEAALLKYFDFVREYDMYLFLPLATFFGFSYISQVELPDNPVYKKLRMLSSLIFYSHVWVSKVAGKILRIINDSLPETCLLFILTLIITIVVSIIVIKLSDVSELKWLKKLYT